MSGKNIFIILSLALFAVACKQNDKADQFEADLEVFSTDSLRQDLMVLAADSMLGRKPFTEGEIKTINFLQKRFKELGLEPGNGDSYLQSVPMVNIRATAVPKMEIKSPEGKFDLKAFDDYVIWTDKTDEKISLENTPIVFAGYGVVAPEHGWNDYEGLDARGKIVLVMVNDPGFWVNDTTLFKGDTMTYYGRWTYKFEEAARQGAKGCLVIHNTRAASYPFSVQQNSFNTSRLQLDNRGKDIQNADVIGWITEDATNRLFKAAGYDSTLLIKANEKGFKYVPLDLTASTSMTVKSDYNVSYNVVGKITGTKHPDEVIIYTAHWDHLGIGRPDATGDTIYNGAVDNASGTAGLLELARVFKSMKTQPERTIVFLAVTAEEQGLLGSKYYTQDPIYPVDKTVANINMDVLATGGRTKDVVVVGQGQSDLEDMLRKEVERAGGYISFDAHPEAGMYFRSDHFNFAKVGIPALYMGSGIDLEQGGKEEGLKLSNKYTADNYHQPSDNYNPGWSLEGGIKNLKYLFLVGSRLAWSDTWPQWKDGSEFKSLRDKK
ncbi:MAG: M20/M25/M40 family metallo-hydrolase [Chitinophagaceae bacterium]|nr:M20/M25/M40 family metallo-hydrolase [Chitinophagaceae bacterium]